MSIRFEPSLLVGEDEWKKEMHDSLLVFSTSLDKISSTLQLIIYNEIKDLPYPVDGWKVADEVKNETVRALLRYLFDYLEPKLNNELTKMIKDASGVIQNMFICQRIDALTNRRNRKAWLVYVKEYARERAIRRRHAILEDHPWCGSVTFTTPSTWE